MTGILNRLFYTPVPSTGLAVYRIGFGLLNAVGLLRFWYLGWIERSFLEPQFLFKYWGFEWVQLWPGQGIYIHFAVLTVVCLSLAAGLFTRIMSVLFFLGFTYIELLDQSNYLNHYYLISLLAFVNCFLPLNARWSLDVLAGFRKREEWVPSWTINWLRFQVGTVYFFAGLAKLGPDWLLHAQPMNTWMLSHIDKPVIGWLFGEISVHYVMSWAGFLFDISIPFWLAWARSRKFAYAAVVIFHVATYMLFPIGMFPFIMIFSALVFFPMSATSASPAAKVPSSHTRLQKGLAASLVLWFVMQWTMPLRHFLYPGDVLWNEEGMRFSWKVMIREKNGEAVFRVVDRQSGDFWFVSGSEFLLRHQEAEMSGTPDMILQFAHHLRDKFAREDGLEVAVYVDTLTSFNGRSAVPLIDPQVDLTQQHDSLWPKKWILPAPQTEPHRLSLKGSSR